MSRASKTPRDPARRRLLRAALGLPLAAAAAACAELVPGRGPPPDLFRLTPKSSFDPDLPEVRWQVTVPPPIANAGLDTTRIALQRIPTQIEYYARAGWIDRAPFMVQTLMIESFENSERIVGVARETSGLNTTYTLSTELREFQVIYYDGLPPKARVGINAKLILLPERIIVGNSSFESIVEAERDEMVAIVAAFDEALGKVLRSLVGWTLRTGEEMYQRRERLRRGPGPGPETAPQQG